ncbi:MAG TPA: hypothetical protein VNJ01_03780 [Bacteriovoracaceae bacterium]|nr:hypothetical protein [Bacteriovoracaceae bacterium]
MLRLNGNTILIVDADKDFCQRLDEMMTKHGARCFIAAHVQAAKELMRKFDFDLVVCSYNLTDGFIHQLIDWCEEEVSILPLFTSIGYSLPNEVVLSQRQSIAEVFMTKDVFNIVAAMPKLLFDYQEFKHSLHDTFFNHGLVLEVKVAAEILISKPIEINGKSLLIYNEMLFPVGTFGIIKLSFNDQRQNDSYILPGFFDEVVSEGQIFLIDQKYGSRWTLFLKRLHDKQCSINTFMKKASGF